MSRRPSDEIQPADEAFGFSEVADQVAINIQPGAQESSPLEMLRTARERGVQHNIESLIKISEQQQTLQSRHLFDLVEWPCELGTDDKVKRSTAELRKLVGQALTDQSLADNDLFSVFCQQYMIAKYNLRAERSVTRESEINGILCVLGGAAELAFAPGASKIAGAVLVLAGGVCAGVAEAHHGNGLRVHNIELNYGEAIRLLAGEKFLSELDAVETNQEFGDLFARHQINCKPGLFIRLEEGRLRQDARVIVGSRVAPIPGAERLVRGGREGDEQGNDDGGACVIS